VWTDSSDFLPECQGSVADNSYDTPFGFQNGGFRGGNLFFQNKLQIPQALLEL
jgi:hypothetical protein